MKCPRHAGWLLSSVVFACALPYGRPLSSQQNSTAAGSDWNTGSLRCDRTGWHDIPDDQVANVRPDHRLEAIALLETQDSLALTQEQVEAFTARKRSDAKGTGNLTPYLVRAKSASLTNRTVLPSWCGEDLQVFTGSLGGHTPQKDPVVLFLEKQPRKVFLSYADVK